MSINTGGPAFPQYAPHPDPFSHGMALRDYFAAKAMQGMLANIDLPTDMEAQGFADAAYEVADAMLKAREASK